MNRLLTWTALLAFSFSTNAQLPTRRGIPTSEVPVSSQNPFPAGCAGAQTGSVYRNSTTEPFLAVDPHDPAHLVGAWQQDRWTNGGSNGVLAAVSLNHGRTWTTTSAHFSLCTGGAWERASDPWVAISPDGTVYQEALGVNGAGALTSVLVSRSSDGGFTWGEPTTISARVGDDKEVIAADPNDSRYVYTIWDNTGGDRIPAWFSRTTDGGITWSPSRIIYDPGVAGYATSHQLVVLPDGTLVDVFVLSFPSGNNGRTPTNVVVMRSQDHGVTWSGPSIVAGDQTVGTLDVKTRAGLRTGAGIPSVSVDPASGAIYAVWTDSRFSNGQRDGVAMSKSLDGGHIWSVPVQVNQVPQVQAFTPAVAAASGRVAVTYYDFRQDTNDTSTLLATYWRVVSEDGGASWSEARVAGPFDLLSAPRANGAPFAGDYQGLAASADVFVAFFVTANSGNAANPSSLFASSAERGGDARWNGRTEVNLHPVPLHSHAKEPPNQSQSKNMKH